MKGVKLLCEMIQTPYCASLLRTAALRTLVHVIAKPVGMEYFLRGDDILDENDHPSTGYQTIVRMVTIPQTSRVLDAAEEVIPAPQLF